MLLLSRDRSAAEVPILGYARLSGSMVLRAGRCSSRSSQGGKHSHRNLLRHHFAVPKVIVGLDRLNRYEIEDVQHPVCC